MFLYGISASNYEQHVINNYKKFYFFMGNSFSDLNDVVPE